MIGIGLETMRGGAPQLPVQFVQRFPECGRQSLRFRATFIRLGEELLLARSVAHDQRRFFGRGNVRRGVKVEPLENFIAPLRQILGQHRAEPVNLENPIAVHVRRRYDAMRRQCLKAIRPNERISASASKCSRMWRMRDSASAPVARS